MILHYIFYVRNEYDGMDHDYEIDTSDAVDLILNHWKEYTEDEWEKMSDFEQDQVLNDYQDALKEYFHDLAFEDFKECNMDPYDFYGVSRKDFF